MWKETFTWRMMGTAENKRGFKENMHYIDYIQEKKLINKELISGWKEEEQEGWKRRRGRRKVMTEWQIFHLSHSHTQEMPWEGAQERSNICTRKRALSTNWIICHLKHISSLNSLLFLPVALSILAIHQLYKRCWILFCLFWLLFRKPEMGLIFLWHTGK